jgi:tetratricopeptide (TPR) repeat protein
LEATLALPRPSQSARVRADEAKVRNTLGYLLALMGDPAAALSHFEHATHLFQEGEEQRLTAWSLRGCGFVHMLRGEITRAKDLVEESLAMARDGRDEWGLAWSLFDLGHLAMHEGDLVRAQPLLREGMLRCQRQGILFGQFRALLALGFVLLQGNDPLAAGRLYRDGLALARDVHFRQYTPDGLEGVARVALARGQLTRAVTLFAAAETVRSTTGLGRWPIFQATHTQCLAALHEDLDGDVWEEAWREGADLSAAEAVLYAFRT